MLTTHQLLSHPQVLWATWTRVKRWYALSDAPQQPDWSFRAIPGKQLKQAPDKVIEAPRIGIYDRSATGL